MAEQKQDIVRLQEELALRHASGMSILEMIKLAKLLLAEWRNEND